MNLDRGLEIADQADYTDELRFTKRSCLTRSRHSGSGRLHRSRSLSLDDVRTSKAWARWSDPA